MKNRFYFVFTCLTILCTAGGCVTKRGESGSVDVYLRTSALSVEDIDRIVVTIHGGNINPSMVVTIPGSPVTGWAGTIGGIPTGNNRDFVAEAFDTENQLLFVGEAKNVTISEDTTVTLAIMLMEAESPEPFENAVPRFESVVISDNHIVVGESVTMTVTASDPDDDVLSYLWSGDGCFIDDSLASITWTAPDVGGTYNVVVTVTDPHGAAASLDVDIVVHEGLSGGDAYLDFLFNRWPVVLGLVPNPSRIDVGETTSLDLTAVDPDGDALYYTWSSDCEGTFSDFYTEDPTFTLTATNGGNDCRLSVQISDKRSSTYTPASIDIATGPEVSVEFETDGSGTIMTPDTPWRMVYFNDLYSAGIPCPEPADFQEEILPGMDQWTVQPLFDENMDEFRSRVHRVPPILQHYCLYEYHGDAGQTEMAADNLAYYFEKYIIPPSDPETTTPCKKEISRDSFGVTPMGGTSGSLPSGILDFFQNEFNNKAGKPYEPWSFPTDYTPDRSRLVIIDTAPSSLPGEYPEMATGPDSSPHGYTLWNMAKELLCNQTDGRCIADVSTELAILYTAYDYRDFNLSTKDFTHGGYVGLISNLAQAIYRAVDVEAERNGKLSQSTVLNLSVGWDGKWCGPDVNSLPPHMRAVYHALEVASCRGAITVAASGNRLDFNTSETVTGPMYPAGWAGLPAPTPDRCKELLGNFWWVTDDGPPPMFETAETQPLLWGATGVRSDGEILSNALPMSQATFLAYADHAVVAPRTSNNVLDSSMPETAVLTGSSVAALVASASAAAVAAFEPNHPNVVMENLFGTGRTTMGSGEQYGTPDYYYAPFAPDPTSRIVSVCEAVLGVCTIESSYPCPVCDEQNWAILPFPQSIMPASAERRPLAKQDSSASVDRTTKSVYATPLVIPQPGNIPDCVPCFLSKNGTGYFGFVNPLEDLSIVNTQLSVNGDLYNVDVDDNTGDNVIGPHESATITVSIDPQQSIEQAYLISEVTDESGTTNRILVSDLMVVD